MKSTHSRRGARRLAAALTIAGAMVFAGAAIAMAAGVSMVDNDFSPSRVTIAAGQSVTFTNHGKSPHTATADGGSFDTGTVDPGQSVTVTFAKPGTFAFHCRFHGAAGGIGMAGTITVTGATTGGGTTSGGSTTGSTASTSTGTTSTGTGTLPQTATPLPLIAGLGALTLIAGLVIGRRRQPVAQ